MITSGPYYQENLRADEVRRKALGLPDREDQAIATSRYAELKSKYSEAERARTSKHGYEIGKGKLAVERGYLAMKREDFEDLKDEYKDAIKNAPIKGALKGIQHGAIKGYSYGGPYGAIIGAVVGAVVGGVSGRASVGVRDGQVVGGGEWWEGLIPVQGAGSELGQMLSKYQVGAGWGQGGYQSGGSYAPAYMTTDNWSYGGGPSGFGEGMGGAMGGGGGGGK